MFFKWSRVRFLMSCGGWSVLSGGDYYSDLTELQPTTTGLTGNSQLQSISLTNILVTCNLLPQSSGWTTFPNISQHFNTEYTEQWQEQGAGGEGGEGVSIIHFNKTDCSLNQVTFSTISLVNYMRTRRQINILLGGNISNLIGIIIRKQQAAYSYSVERMKTNRNYCRNRLDILTSLQSVSLWPYLRKAGME